MRKIRKIIVPAIYLNLLLSVSIGFAGVSKEKPARPYELVSKSLKKESVPDSNQSITVSELLKRYVETQEKLKKSYIYKGEDKSETETTRSDRPKLIQGVKYERFEPPREVGKDSVSMVAIGVIFYLNIALRKEESCQG